MNEDFLPSYTKLSKDELYPEIHQHFVGYTGNQKPIIDFVIDICDLNDDIIYWSDIPEIITKYFLMSEISDLVKGLQRLEDAQYLVMRNDIGSEGVDPTYIRLTEPGSTIFMCEWITERLVQASVTPNIPLSFSREINKTKFKIPHEDIVPFDDIASTYKVELTPNLYNPRIFSLDLHTNMLYFTSFSVHFLDQLAINKLEGILKLVGGDIFAMVARICNIDLTDFSRSVAEYNLSDLLNYVQIIYKYYDSLSKTPILKKHTAFLEMISLLSHLLPVSVRFKQDLKQQSERVAQLNAIISEDYMQKKVYTNFQFDSFLDSVLESIYGNAPNEITYQKDQYLEKNVSTALKTTSLEDDILVDFGSHYVYSKHIVNILVDEYPKVRAKVVNLLSENIKNYLLGKFDLRQTIIYNNESSETAIKQCLFKEFPVYYSIIKFPKIMWLTFHSSVGGMIYAEEVSRYFNLNTKDLLPWVDIFHINTRGLCLEVSKNLGIFGQLIMGLKGTNNRLLQHLNKSLQNPKL